ncbi:MAG: sugar transferase [Phycisphaerales bacterium]|nr:sugar transferase [Phycisphaerales bacterium]
MSVGNHAKAAAAPRTLHSILPAAYVGQMLQRERARSERNGHEFAVVLFRVRHRHRSAMRLAREVLKRIRFTDEVGWLNRRYLCVFLPDTNQAGAWCFAADVAHRLESRNGKCRFSVHGYPTAPAGERPAGSAGVGPDLQHVSRQMGATARETSAATPNVSSTVSTPTATPAMRRHDLLSFLVDGVKDGLTASIVSPPPLERIFVKPLPWWKRMMDMLCAGMGLLLLSPLLLAIALIIKLTSKGPVIFKQARAGLGGRPFMIYKFRTMVVDAEARKKALRQFSEQDGPAFKLTNDPRITRIGRILRTTSLDELPQLWNVFVGDMSLVGPRPLPCDEADGCDVWQQRRLDVTPGLTCIWQVEGRSRVTFTEWMRMDIRYLKRRNLLRDLNLLLRTVPAILLRKGAR